MMKKKGMKMKNWRYAIALLLSWIEDNVSVITDWPSAKIEVVRLAVLDAMSRNGGYGLIFKDKNTAMRLVERVTRQYKQLNPENLAAMINQQYEVAKLEQQLSYANARFAEASQATFERNVVREI